MEDVIFAGTRERKPLGMAQVTLTLVDPTGETPLPGLRVESALKPAANGHSSDAANGTTNGNAPVSADAPAPANVLAKSS